MSLFETSSELFEDSDISSESTFESARSESSISSQSDSSVSSDDSSMAGRTRRGRLENLLSQSSGSSSDNQVISESTNNNSESSIDISDQSFSASHSHVSESDLSNNSSRSSQSNDTETYDVEEEMARANNVPVIEINDSQMPSNVQDDDDVILIPQNIETIDLCTQAMTIPLRLRNEVIDITDSPGTDNSHAGPVRRRRRRSRLNEQPEYVNDNSAPETHRPTTSTPNANKRLNLDDSMNDSQPKITLTCPICLDSVVNRTPVSTICGHIFCQACIIQALGNAKKCPMCKKALGARKPYFNIFLPC
ncbi:E3 ubiquitin-protein ligase RNF4-like [Chironomus tepperi]|uniref:E3 ubiquitin-protein ligase RNF4-like n=1 Tax=Chironomus tepperi TaxID=113505 RepID=UPI00391EF3E7